MKILPSSGTLLFLWSKCNRQPETKETENSCTWLMKLQMVNTHTEKSTNSTIEVYRKSILTDTHSHILSWNVFLRDRDTERGADRQRDGERRGGGEEREGERETHTHRGTQTDRQTDRERQTDRWREKGVEEEKRERVSKRGRKRHRQTGRQAGRDNLPKYRSVWKVWVSGD